MNKDIKVSVIVPVYNTEKFLHRCVDSLLNQTLEDIEIILVDDGSKDSSPAICDEYAEKYDNIAVLHLENGGPARARNKGIEIAKGDYIGFADSDDYCHVEQFEKLYNNAKENNSDIAMCSFFVDNTKEIKPVNIAFDSLCSSNDEIKNRIISCFYGEYVHGLNSLWIKIFKRSMLMNNNIRMNENLMRAEDMWFIFDALKVSNVFSFIPDNLYYYYHNDLSIMHNPKNDSYDHWVTNRQRLLKENETLNLDIDYNLFYKDFIYKTIMFCRDKVKLNQKEIVRSVLEDFTFKNAISYDANLPIHIRLINSLIKMKFIGFAILFLKLW